MSSDTTIMIARMARAAAATAVFAAVSAFAAAHAEMIGPALFVAPTITLVATPAGTPTAIAAVATPVAPPARPVPIEPMKPAALPPANAPAATAAISCSAPAEFARLDRPLIAMARRLASGEPLTIVAIGSSSTAGAGASSPAANYPNRLAAELRERFPGHDITVLNRGVNGEETDQMMARFDADVFAAHPQLVLWQVGTNSVLRDHPLKPHEVQLHEGIDELKAAGYGRSDLDHRQGKERRSVPPLRRHARLARGPAPAVRYVRVAGRAAHERLGLCLLGEAHGRRDRRSGDAPGGVGCGPYQPLN
jgi:lysophospholipase L1-like esterase